MPAIVAAALAQTAVAAPVVAGTTAGLGAAALPAAATLAPSVAQTAGLELAKQQAIQEGMRQAGQAGIQQAAQTTAQQAAQTATQKAVETAAQQGLDPSKLDYLRSSTASLNPTAPSQFLPPKAPAGDLMSQINNMNPANFADDIAAASQGGTGYSGYSQVFGPQPPAPYGGATPPVSTAPAAPLAPAGGGGPPLAFKEAAGLGNAPPELTQNFLPKAPFNDPGTLARAASDKGISDLTMRPASESMFKPTFETQFPLAEKSALEKGIETGLKYVKDNPISSGLSLMTLGQYMNKPKEEDKDKYKNKVDMSEFQPSLPSVGAFKPSYEYQKYAAEGGLMGYAVGGPVEQMSALNSVGANTQYPMAGLATPLYSNPAIQRPEAVNVISPSAEPAVGMYSGEQKFAEGGISDEMAREYGLKNRKQRAAKSLTKDYEEMEAERNREATAFANSVNINSETNPKIIRRSRTQELSSPYSAAIEEHNRLAKRTKTPKFELAKTSLGDIDTYMDVPVEAARGGIMGNLGSYSDGGRLLRGPGDGVSDSIPAVIGKRQPARLADGEFVIPARIVSELGNGSTEAGARKLYAMMERIQSARKKSIGKKKVAVNSRADKHLPA